jgi:hypothetical protein
MLHLAVEPTVRYGFSKFKWLSTCKPKNCDYYLFYIFIIISSVQWILLWVFCYKFYYITLNSKVISEQWTWKDLKGGSCGLIMLLSWNVPQETDGNHKNS